MFINVSKVGRCSSHRWYMEHMGNQQHQHRDVVALLACEHRGTSKLGVSCKSLWILYFFLSFFISLCIYLLYLFPNSLSQWGLQPRIAAVCTGAGGGTGSTRFPRRFRRFQRRSGRLWCRARSGSTRFRRTFREGSRKPWCKDKSKSGSTGFRRRFRRRSGEGPGEGLGGFGAEPGQIQQGSGEEPGEVQQGSGEGSGEGLHGRLWCHVSFNRVPEKVPEGFGAEPGQVQQDSGEALGGFGAEPGQVRICGHLIHGSPAGVFPALSFAARFRKIWK